MIEYLTAAHLPLDQLRKYKFAPNGVSSTYEGIIEGLHVFTEVDGRVHRVPESKLGTILVWPLVSLEPDFAQSQPSCKDVIKRQFERDASGVQGADF